MYRKVLALFLSVAFLLSISGCKTKLSSKDNESENKSEAETEEDLVTVYALTKMVYSDTERVFEFDRYGNITVAAEYDNGEEDYRQEIEYEYDRNGNIIRSSYKNDNFEDYRRVTEYTYDSDGNMILAVSTRDGQEIERIEYAYDHNGNVILQLTDYGNGRETYREEWEYEYDNSGRITQKDHYYNDGSSHSSISYQYDSKGNRVQEIQIGVMHSDNYDKIIYEYDAQGNLVQEVYFDKYDEKTGYTVYEYDTQGNRTLAIHYRDGQELSRDEYSSDGMMRIDSDSDDYEQYTKLRVRKSQADRLMLLSDYIYIYDHSDK